jgi:hypothetical protein
MRYLLFQEVNIDGGPITLRYSEEEAINEQKSIALRFHNHTYNNDQEALDDFIAVNWATWEDEDEQLPSSKPS